MSNGVSIPIAEHFEELSDPRMERTKKHRLLDIVLLSICAVIAGAEGWEDIEEFGKQKMEWLKRFLELPNGIPSHDTISRVFRLIKPAEFRKCFLSWTQSLQEKLGLKQVAIDGKTLRGSHDRRSMKGALHVVSAWCTENNLVFGQEAVGEKSNEITAIPKLLELLDLKGAIVSIDAIGCQKAIAQQIVNAEADFVLSVKDNQPKLHTALHEHFLEIFETEELAAAGVRKLIRHDNSHGRTVERQYFIAPVPDTEAWAEFRAAWPGLRSIGMVITLSTRDGKETSGVRYYITSLEPRVKQFAQAVRSHWGIENSLHWVLDVSFGEDHSRIRKDHAPENFGLLRRLALTLIQRDRSPGSVRRKRKRAAWNDKELLKIILGKT